MTRWIEDAPEGHVWVKPTPDACSNCQCHTARVCDDGLWMQARRPTNPDGSPYTKPCPCEQAKRAKRIERFKEALQRAHDDPAEAARIERIIAAVEADGS